MTVFLAALAMWGLCGVVIAALLARHGHNFWLYAVLGLGYGPFLVAIWLSSHADESASETIIAEGEPANVDGWVDVLVGLDGTDSAVTSTAEVLELLGAAVRRVRLVSALDHEVTSAMARLELDDHRRDHLKEAASAFGFPNAELALIAGQPDKALVQHAIENEFGLVVVAHRRSTALGAVRGTTVGRLARNAEVPVLIGPPAPDKESS